MSEVAIRVENLGKRYRVGELKTYKTLRDTIMNRLHAPLQVTTSILKGRRPGTRDSLSENFIWALKGVSFEIKRGEVVGIIGRNGAGKSTFLKIISRITEPTEGLAEIHGRVGSLLEVGTGFHPELTGRENIYLNGAILGMKRREIERKFEEIVAFSDVERFIDTPVKHYSSGMHVRLGFAVAAHLEPENLFVDEVLAVGDASFQRKCIGKMGDVAKEGRTVLFVSHNMGTIRSLCERAIWLDQGRTIMDGDPTQVISAYLSRSIGDQPDGQVVWSNEEDAPGGEELKLTAIRLIGPEGRVASVFEVDKPIRVEICYNVKRTLHTMRIRLSLLTPQGEIAFETTDHNLRKDEIQPGTYRSTCTIPGGLLNIGQYIVRVGGGMPGIKILLPAKEYLKFSTAGISNQGSYYDRNWPGVVCPKLDWIIERIS